MIKQFFALQNMDALLKIKIVKTAVLLTVAFISFNLLAQDKKKEAVGESKRCLIFSGFAGLSVPGADLARDYGSFGEIGGGILYQSKTKWLIGIDLAYLFGNTVTNDPVANLRNEEGNIIGNNGSYATFKVFQRGFNLPIIKLGKTIPLRKNPKYNTHGGLTLMAGGGWLQHWTYIQDLSKKTDQFSKDYIDGYDQLRNGPGFGGWIGYIFLPEKSKLNFHLEGGYFAGFTEKKRYDFANNIPAGQKKTDSMLQLRLRICFTIRSKAEEEYYYY